MMKDIFQFFVVVLFLIIKVNGSDNVTYPNFSRQAEFTIESIIVDGQHQRSIVEYIYDYDENYLIVISDLTFEYYNYTSLQKVVYSRDSFKQCNIYPIDIDNESDGLSAVYNSMDNTTHIRPLYDLLLFTLNATYIGEDTLRGWIDVSSWSTSTMTNDTNIIWSFARSTYIMPWKNENYTIPVQRLIKRKSDGAILEILNIFRYKSMITRRDLTPPKGIYCEGLLSDDDLLSLQDYGMTFTDQYSVRIDAFTMNTQQLWHSVHLRYHLKDGRKLIRYDYAPSDNTENPMTVIFDYMNDKIRSYTIDRRTGSCAINLTSEIFLATSILHEPIETLIKYENLLIANPPHRFFQYTGDRHCRGSIVCKTFVGVIPLFPPDTQDKWLTSTIEWGWSKRNIDDKNSSYDYPVYLDLNLYKTRNDPPSNVHYEFYDYRNDVYLNEFDIDLCYRSNQLWYRHLAFQFKIISQDTTDGIEDFVINRRQLIEFIHGNMSEIMTVNYSRISQIEIDHHSKEEGHNDTIYCIFTLLDRTPFVTPTSEIEILEAQMKLEDSINKGQFQIGAQDGLKIQAIPGSLEQVQYFYGFNPNVTVNQINFFYNTTIKVNRTIVETIEEIVEKIDYSDGSQAGAVIGGTIVGILFGTVFVFLIVKLIKRKANGSPTGGLTFRNISFRVKKNRSTTDQAMVSMEHPTDERKTSD